MKSMQREQKNLPKSSPLNVTQSMWRSSKPVSSTESATFFQEKPFCPCDGTCPQCADGDLESHLLKGDPLLESIHDGQGMVCRYSHSRGEPVRKIQAGLKKLDPAALPVYGVDGIFGPETEGAVRNFQRVSYMDDYKQDGKVGPITLGALDDQLAARKTKPLCPIGYEFMGSPDECERPTIPTDCACDCQSYCKDVARHYAVKEIIPRITWFGNSRPKNLKILNRQCNLSPDPYADCTWSCSVEFEYESKKFKVVVIYLATKKLFYAVSPQLAFIAPVCLYGYKCGQPLTLYEALCYNP